MSEFKGTPGPWIAAPYSSVVGAPVVAAISGRPIAKITYFPLGDGFENHERESIANGKLVESAPDLLNELFKQRDNLVSLRDFDPPDVRYFIMGEMIDEIDAAIDKALGKQK